MGSHARTEDRARARARAQVDSVLQELRRARLERNVSGATVARAIGCSAAQYSRLERGLGGELSVERAAVALSAVGLELSVRVYPGGPPIRDVAHRALIGRLTARCHDAIRVMTEMPLPIAGDPRAWDVVLARGSWRHPVEAETRPMDVQALLRRIALKRRDAGMDASSLLLLDSRHNRELVRSAHTELVGAFPVPARVALAALERGEDPGAGAVFLL